MIVSMNSKTFTVYATVTCPLVFPDWGTVEIVTYWCWYCGYCSTQWLVLILNSNRVALFCWIKWGPFWRINLCHIQRDILHKDQMLEDHHRGHAHGTCQTDYKTHNIGGVHSLLFRLCTLESLYNIYICMYIFLFEI